MSYVSLKQMAESKVDGIQKTTQFQCDPRLLEVEREFKEQQYIHANRKKWAMDLLRYS